MTNKEKIVLFETGLVQFQHIKSGGNAALAAKLGFETLLKSAAVKYPFSSTLQELHLIACQHIPHLSQIIPLGLSLPDILQRLEGILIERAAFYKQSNNLEHWVTLSGTSS